MHSKFKIGEIIYYTPNIENLKPINERTNDICEVIELLPSYATVRFLESGQIHKILYDSLQTYNNNINYYYYYYYQKPIQIYKL